MLTRGAVPRAGLPGPCGVGAVACGALAWTS